MGEDGDGLMPSEPEVKSGLRWPLCFAKPFTASVFGRASAFDLTVPFCSSCDLWTGIVTGVGDTVTRFEDVSVCCGGVGETDFMGNGLRAGGRVVSVAESATSRAGSGKTAVAAGGA